MKLKWNKRKKREGEKKKKNGIIQYLRYPERKVEALLPFVFSFPFSRYTVFIFPSCRRNVDKNNTTKQNGERSYYGRIGAEDMRDMVPGSFPGGLHY